MQLKHQCANVTEDQAGFGVRWLCIFIVKNDFCTKHITITLVGRGIEVQQLVHGVSIRLDGVDVLIVRVVGVHHHTQLAALEKGGQCHTGQRSTHLSLTAWLQPQIEGKTLIE